MDEGKGRYYDFSDDDWLMDEFDPDQITDICMQIHGGVIRRHLQVNNPIKGIQGLLGYLIVTNAANSDNVEARLGWLTFLGLINAGLLAYIAYVLT